MKVFAYVEGIENRHREGQQLVSRYYNQLLGLESDPACKDESRMCYFSYSPNGYVAALYQAFVLEPLIKEETNTFSENEVLPPFPLQDNTPENVSEEEIAQFISSYIFFHPLTAGQRHSNAHSHESLFRNRGVLDSQVAVLFQKSFCTFEVSADEADILSQHNDIFIPLHLFIQCFRNQLRISYFSHGSILLPTILYRVPC